MVCRVVRSTSWASSHVFGAFSYAIDPAQPLKPTKLHPLCNRCRWSSELDIQIHLKFGKETRRTNFNRFAFRCFEYLSLWSLWIFPSTHIAIHNDLEQFWSTFMQPKHTSKMLKCDTSNGRFICVRARCVYIIFFLRENKIAGNSITVVAHTPKTSEKNERFFERTAVAIARPNIFFPCAFAFTMCIFVYGFNAMLATNFFSLFSVYSRCIFCVVFVYLLRSLIRVLFCFVCVILSTGTLISEFLL